MSYRPHPHRRAGEPHLVKRLAYTDNEQELAKLELAENLRRCRELMDRLGPSDRRYHPDSYGARHLHETGHHLGFGCCSRDLRSRPTGSSCREQAA